VFSLKFININMLKSTQRVYFVFKNVLKVKHVKNCKMRHDKYVFLHLVTVCFLSAL